MIGPLLDLLFPNLCIQCSQSLVGNERYFCLGCSLQLPETQYHLQNENQVEKSLWGRIPFERAFSFLYFTKTGVTQRILHQLKYKGDAELAHFLGTLYGAKLSTLKEEIGFDSVVAIPLHKSKELKRGYNQSKAFSDGICESLHIENLSSAVTRTFASETQTRKNRQERWENVKTVFVNIFGGIVRTDLVANGIVNAVRDIDLKVPVVIRLVRTNEEEGRRVIQESGLNFIAETNLPEAAKKAVELASRRG